MSRLGVTFDVGWTQASDKPMQMLTLNKIMFNTLENEP